jgi:hypothetical protein
MTAASITFEQIEERAETSLAWAIWAKRASATALSVVVGNAFLAVLAGSLKSLDQALTTEALEKLSPEQLKDLSVKLKELLPRLNSLCGDVKTEHLRKFFFTGLVNQVCEAAEDLESAHETIRFALRPDFNSTLTSAIERLKLGAENSASTKVTMSH